LGRSGSGNNTEATGILCGMPRAPATTFDFQAPQQLTNINLPLEMVFFVKTFERQRLVTEIENMGYTNVSLKKMAYSSENVSVSCLKRCKTRKL